MNMFINGCLLWAASLEDLTGKAQTFGLDGTKLIAQLIIFVILFLALKKFAFAPILAVLDDRKRRIEESLANAEKIKQELADAEIKRAELIKQANAEATRMIEEARASADAIGGRKIQEATAQAESVLTKAREAAERDRDQLMNQLRSEMGRLVVETTAKVVGKTLTPEDQKRLQDEAMGQLA
ncbi:MAG: F0F1 ATP synthase subunit B [Candidatus Methylacidiphilales bacterium]